MDTPFGSLYIIRYWRNFKKFNLIHIPAWIYTRTLSEKWPVAHTFGEQNQKAHYNWKP